MPFYPRTEKLREGRRGRRYSKRLKAIRGFSKVRTKNTSQMIRFNNSKNRRRLCTCRRRIGNTPTERRYSEPKPLIDVLDEKNEIVIVAEFVGFNRADLRTRVNDKKLVLSAESFGRKYYKSLNLPKRVIPSAISTTYKNGVLEIRLRKTLEEETINKVAG